MNSQTMNYDRENKTLVSDNHVHRLLDLLYGQIERDRHRSLSSTLHSARRVTVRKKKVALLEISDKALFNIVVEGIRVLTVTHDTTLLELLRKVWSAVRVHKRDRLIDIHAQIMTKDEEVHMTSVLQVGQEVTLKTGTITPITAKVVELGNTYVVVESLSRHRQRIPLRDAHHHIEGYYLYEQTPAQPNLLKTTNEAPQPGY